MTSGPARRHGWLAAGLGLVGFVALNLVPVAGRLTPLAVGAWVLSWLGALYVAGVAHRLARWATIGDDPGVTRLDGDLGGYATTVDGRRVTVSAGRRQRVRPRFDLVAEAELSPDDADVDGVVLSVERGEASAVDTGGEGVVTAAAGLAGSGRVVVDSEAGVVRFESEGLLDDPAELHEQATALAATARAVETDGERTAA